MKRLVAFAVLLLPALVGAQTRQLGVGALIIDDNGGHAIRLRTPGGLTSALTDWTLPIPPIGVTSGFVEAGTASNLYLNWNNLGSYWQATSSLLVFPYAQTGSNASTLWSLIQTGAGGVASYSISNAANTNTTLAVSTNGTGKGIAVQLSNGANSSSAIEVTHTGSGTGVFATSFSGQGLWGVTGSSFSAAVLADNTAGGEAVTGRNNSITGIAAVVGRNDGAGCGVKGFTTGAGAGIWGVAGTSSSSGIAGRFENTYASNASDVLQVTSNGTGKGINVQMTNGSSTADAINVTNFGSGTGAFVSSTGGQGLWGITGSSFSAAVLGDNSGGGEAVTGRTNSLAGIAAVVGRNDGAGVGVKGFTTGTGPGIWGVAGTNSSSGVAGRFENTYASNTSDVLQVVQVSSGRAANFTGNVLITGNLTVTGAVAKGSGSFMIDHPLDPKNKILYHSFVESPDMKNIYDGVTVLDGAGHAIVTMPEWFDALNADFRYQLTAVGAPGPGLYVAKEIAGNTFEIAGGTPGAKVSWQVTGIRHDAYANAHRLQVEVDKTPDQRGTYLHPEAYGVPQSTLTRRATGAEVNTASTSPTPTAISPANGAPSLNAAQPAPAILSTASAVGVTERPATPNANQQ